LLSQSINIVLLYIVFVVFIDSRGMLW